MEFRILGPLEVVSAGGEVLGLGGVRQRTVLAVLCASPNQVVSRDQLIDSVWGESPPRTAQGTLQAYVSRLRGILGAERIISRDPGYLLRLGPEELDAETAVRLFDESRRALESQSPAEALRRCRQALGLWRGPPLADFLYEDFAQTQVARLEELRMSVLETRLEAELALGRHAEVIGELERLVAEHPLRERFWDHLMLALYRSGRQAEALRTYQRAREVLGEELGIEPSPDLQRLEDQILRQDSSITLSAPPTSAAPVPVTLTFFFCDIEGSTQIVESVGPEVYAVLLSDYHSLVAKAVGSAGGEMVGKEGDGLFCAFRTASSALEAAASTATSIRRHAWPEGTQVRARIGLHTGEALRTGEGDYVSVEIHRADRLAQAAWGGQILVSETTWNLTRGELAEDLGFSDLGAHRLKDFSGPVRLFQLLHPELPAQFPPPRVMPERPTSLPVQLTSFVGRQAELATLQGLIDEERLVTVTGPGGVGKTRLVVEAAEAVADRYPDGVWFVDLAPITEPKLVVSTVAAVLGVAQLEPPGLAEAVAVFLKNRRALLVVDNCEQVLEPVAAAVHGLLSKCPAVDILTTSREPLALPEERLYRLHGLGIPDPHRTPAEVGGAGSVRLLVERTRSVRPEFAVDEDNAAAVVAICRALDGVPLALELVAARLQSMSPEEAVSQLGDQLHFLSVERRGVPDRHRTLRATIEWSYRLAEEPERDLLRRLAVFRGGFELEAVTAVTPDAAYGQERIETLERLVVKSLVSTRFSDGRSRYDLSESVRAYALEELAAAEADQELGRLHASYFLSLAEEADPQLSGPDQHQWITRLDAEKENFRAAWEWFTGQEAWAEALALATRLGWFHLIRGYLAEGRQMLEQAFAHDPESPGELQAEARNLAGVLAGQQGDNPGALQHFEHALRLRRNAGDRGGEAAVLANMAVAADMTSDLISKRMWLEGALSLLRSLDHPSDQDRIRYAACLNSLAGLELTFGNLDQTEILVREILESGPDDQYMRCRALEGLAEVAVGQGRVAEASELIEQAIGIATELGDRPALAQMLTTKGEILTGQGEREEAAQTLDEAINLLRELGDDYHLPQTLQAAGRTAVLSGDREAASRLLSESLKLTEARGNRIDQAACLEALALFSADEDVYAAAVLLGAAQAIRKSFGVPDPHLYRDDLDRVRSQCRSVLGDEAFDAALADAAIPDNLDQFVSSLRLPLGGTGHPDRRKTAASLPESG